MGSEGEGGTPKPTALQIFSASAADFTVQNPLSAPAVPQPLIRCPPFAREVGFETAAAQGQTERKPPEIREIEHNQAGPPAHGKICWVRAGGCLAALDP